MSNYEKYEELKRTLVVLECEEIQLKRKISDVKEELQKVKDDLRKEGNVVCEYCGEPLCPEDGRCYNSSCEAYDPLSQYFD